MDLFPHRNAAHLAVEQADKSRGMQLVLTGPVP